MFKNKPDRVKVTEAIAKVYLPAKLKEEILSNLVDHVMTCEHTDCFYLKEEVMH